jgi:hypothetical protein
MSFKTQEIVVAISFTSESGDHYLFLEKISIDNLAERLKSDFGSELGYLEVDNIKCLDCSKQEFSYIQKTILKILNGARDSMEDL